MDSSAPPADERAAAHWLLARHRYLVDLVGRLTEPRVVNESDPFWPGALWTIVEDADRYDAAWRAYQDAVPAPQQRAGQSDQDFYRELEAWQDAGPQVPGRVRPLLVMSGGEVRLIRTLATLGGRVPWEAADLAGLASCPDDPSCPGLAADILAVMSTRV